MLYLESPIGVGFSYATDSSSDETVNDKITGKFYQFDCSILTLELSTNLLFLFYFSLFSSQFFFFSLKSCKKRKINPFFVQECFHNRRRNKVSTAKIQVNFFLFLSLPFFLFFGISLVLHRKLF